MRTGSRPRGDIENTSFDNESFAAFLSRTWDVHTIAASFDKYNSRSDVYVDPAVRTTPPFVDFRIEAPVRDRTKLALFYDGEEMGESLENVHLDLYYQESDREFNTFTDMELDFGEGPVLNQTSILTSSELDTIGSNGHAGLRLAPDLRLIAGYETKKDSLDQDRQRAVSRDGVLGQTELSRDEARQTSFEIFAENVWSFAKDWELRAGARGIWVETKLKRNSQEEVPTGRTDDTYGVLSAGVTYRGIENFTTWFAWSQGYVYPTMINLATGAFAGPDFVNPNPNLRPETSNTVELGTRFNDDLFGFESALFYTRGRQYIDDVLCVSVDEDCFGPLEEDERIYVNIDEVQSFGAELATHLDLKPARPYLSGAWIRRRFDNAVERTYDTGLPIVSRADRPGASN